MGECNENGHTFIYGRHKRGFMLCLDRDDFVGIEEKRRGTWTAQTQLGRRRTVAERMD